MITKEQLDTANEMIKKIDFKGKGYALVASRVSAFRAICPRGRITTDILSLENGVVTMKATVYDDDDRELANGYAQEKEGASYINKTSFIENCVPLDTEILTQNGWKYYYQLKNGENVLSLNMETKKIEYCKLLKVNIHENRPIIELKTSRFETRCTPQHKWIVRSQYSDIHKEETLNIKTSEKIVQNILQIDVVPSEMGRKLGWLMCDCEIIRTKNGMPSTAYISQSKHIDDVKELFGEPSTKSKLNENWKENYEWIIPSDVVRNILGYFNISSYSDLMLSMLTADISDVAGCYQSMMLADGESRGFSSTYLELVEAVQVMCARLGISTGKIKSRLCKLSTRPVYTLSIKKTDGAWFSEIKIKDIPPTDVWCPTTENGTWFMRQGNFVTLTSNCETSAIGRALGNLGIGSDENISSAEELANAVLNQNTDAIPKKQEKKPTKSDDQKNAEMVAGVNPLLLPDGKGMTKERMDFLHQEIERTGINNSVLLGFAKVQKYEDMNEATYIALMNKLAITKDKA